MCGCVCVLAWKRKFLCFMYNTWTNGHALTFKTSQFYKCQGEEWSNNGTLLQPPTYQCPQINRYFWQNLNWILIKPLFLFKCKWKPVSGLHVLVLSMVPSDRKNKLWPQGSCDSSHNNCIYFPHTNPHTHTHTYTHSHTHTRTTNLWVAEIVFRAKPDQ